MKRVVKIFCIIIILLLISLSIFIPIKNNLVAYSVKNSLKNIPLPEKTELCDSISSAGKLVGSGNGMQYFGAILLKSDLTLDELKNYYSQYQKNSWSCLVEKQSSNQITVIEHGYLAFESLEDVRDFSRYFIVYSWGDSNFILSDLDLRGH